MPRNQRFPHARRQRRSHALFVLTGAGLAFAAVLVAPGLGPRGSVLDLQGQGGAPNAIALGPAPATASPVAVLPVAPTPSSRPAVGAPRDPGQNPDPGQNSDQNPAPAPNPDQNPDQNPDPAPNPRTGTTTRPAVIGTGVPPSRLASEITGTKAPSVELLTGYRWPVSKVRLTLPFGPTPWGSRLVDGEPFHDGIDLATFCGDRIVAAHDGVVLAAGRRYDAYMGWVGDLGPYQRRLERKKLWMTLPIVVVTDDGNGYRSIYAHFGRIVVEKGQVVKAGELLGYEGATGRASGCHVHYGLFSPWETETFRIKPDVVKRMKLPTAETARIDPLLVLPPKAGVNAPRP